MNHNNILVIDIGNSNILLGIYTDSQLIAKQKLASNPKTGSEVYAAKIKQWLTANLKEKAVIAVYCSVVPDLDGIITSALRSIAIDEIHQVTNRTKLGVPILIDKPNELGADRIVNVYGAFLKHKQSLIIIDFGSATTFDIVNNNGDYIGGIIACGVQLGLQALADKTALLPLINPQSPTKLIGKNTAQCMLSGAINGYSLMCNGLIDSIADEIESDPLIIITGGLASIMHRTMRANMRKTNKRAIIVDEELTIWALYKIYHNIIAL